MARKRLVWQLFPAYLFLTLAAVVAVSVYALNAFRDFYFDQIESDLQARAWLVERQVAGRFSEKNAPTLDALAQELGKNTGTRVTLILPSGQVLGDSHEDPARMENHANRPEIRQALQGEPGTSRRFSRTVGEKLMYFALPVKEEGRVRGVVRTAMPLTVLNRELQRIEIQIGWGSLGVALLLAGFSLVISRRLARPLEEMKQGAERFARGDLSGRLPEPGSQEVGGLGRALNQMARELDDRIRTITAQSNERQAVLSSMVEGVVAVDVGERVLSMNGAAARLMGVDPQSARGRTIQEVIRNPDLQVFVKQTLDREKMEEADVVVRNESDRYLQVRGTVLKDEADRAIGAVIVLNDVTRLRRLENVRRDFVANVSHELKTPITSLKGFVETLLAGAMEDPQERKKFLEILARQVDRLNAIIEDLLSLSRLEQEAERARIEFELVPLQGLLETAIESCGVKAREKNTRVDLQCESGLRARVNPPLFEQAVMNLVDNAIKYSEAENRVEVRAAKESGAVVVRVRDWGCGIAPDHLPRLFERFYRVDRARSRDLGGTGLGLAIVKHIAQVHGGYVEVDSTPGRGSLFSIHLPQNSG